MKIGAISLGCDKNRVDTEKMLARLVEGGHKIVSDIDSADVIIINTCAFIDSAKEESIDEIFNALDTRKHVIVTGCLAKRYPAELQDEFEGVDAFLGVDDYDNILDCVNNLGNGKFVKTEGGDAFYEKREITTPYHYAYLKIADGCDNHCTYCAIPSIRGKYRSESMQNLLKEAKLLADDGVKELILVAQDVSRYGVDFDGKPHLCELVRALEELPFERIRLLYLEPEMVSDDLIEFVKTEPKVVKYMDIPLQHIDSDILKRMNRKGDEQYVRDLVRRVKEAGITLRSTFICGFPGESEAQFKKLKKFISEGNIDYAGFFAYSKEEGTAAARMRGQIPDDTKQERADELKKLQAKLIKKRNAAKVGNVCQIVYDGEIDFDSQMFIGRLPTQAPDVDSVVLFTADKTVMAGELYDVELVGVKDVDLIGRVV